MKFKNSPTLKFGYNNLKSMHEATSILQSMISKVEELN
jgi:hypothetical protein